MVFQSGALFDSLTVGENIAFPLKTATDMTAEQNDARVAELARDAGSHRSSLDKLPSELSTGTKRAVAIARALAQDPEAILYDEPTTMVDPLMAAHTGDLDPAAEGKVAQDFGGGHARYASGKEAGRPPRVSAGRARGLFSARGPDSKPRRIRSCAISACRMS